MSSSCANRSADAEKGAGVGAGYPGAVDLAPEPWLAFLAIDFLVDRRGLNFISRCTSSIDGNSRTYKREGDSCPASVRDRSQTAWSGRWYINVGCAVICRKGWSLKARKKTELTWLRYVLSWDCRSKWWNHKCVIHSAIMDLCATVLGQ